MIARIVRWYCTRPPCCCSGPLPHSPYTCPRSRRHEAFLARRREWQERTGRTS